MSVNCRTLDNDTVQRLSTCPDCGEVHWYNTNQIGLRVDAYNIKWKQTKDDMRQRHRKDLLQPMKDGKPNEEFIKTYGKPYGTHKSTKQTD